MRIAATGAHVFSRISDAPSSAREVSPEIKLPLAQLAERVFPGISKKTAISVEATQASERLAILVEHIESSKRRGDLRIESAIETFRAPGNNEHAQVDSYVHLIQTLGSVYRQHNPSDILKYHDDHTFSFEHWHGVSEMVLETLQEENGALDLHGAYRQESCSSEVIPSILTGIEAYHQITGRTIAINLRGSSFRDSDIAALCTAIEKGFLHSLDISQSNLKDAEGLVLAKAISNSPTFSHLNISENTLTLTTALPLVKAICSKEATELDISKNGISSCDELTSCVTAFSSLHI